MGNMCGGEGDNANVGHNYKVDRSDPTKKKKKKTNKGKGAGMADGNTQGFNEEVSEAVKNSEFAPDPELEQGFPEDKVEYTTKPCLADVEDEYTQQDKARTLKKKDRTGAGEAFQGDADFAKIERVSE